jgi:NitT/TauT family transport system ATP-binding protein
MPPIVTLTDVRKRYADGTAALDGVDLAIRPGDFTSLLGPSGCGKSTVLRLIAGLTAPSGGSVAWENGAAAAGGQLGFVFQEPTLMPWARVFDNVLLPLRLAGAPRDAAEAKAFAALAQVGLAGFEQAFPRQLSGGMKMRVSIARALVTTPRLLLLDEPFAALDEITRLKLNEDLLTLWRSKGLTVVFVTHSVFESVYLSNRILVMSARPGRIAADIAIDAPYPRGAAFRLSSSYARQCAFVSEALAEAMAA